MPRSDHNVQASQLRDEVWFFQPVNEDDEYGEPTETLVPSDPPALWCSIQPLRGREIIQAQQAQSTVTHRLETYYVPDLTPHMVAEFEGRRFAIESVIDVDNQHSKLEIMCHEIVMAPEMKAVR